MLYKNRGFTLLEILIALFIFTIVSLIMTKALHTVITTQASTEKNAERLAQMQIALLLFSRDLEQAIDRPISSQEGTAEAAFIGGKNALRFSHTGFANPDGKAQKSSLERSGYRVEGGEFIRDTWDALDLAPHAAVHSRRLLSGVQQLYFRYLDNKNVFHSFWPPDTQRGAASGRGKLPRAVEITFVLANEVRLQQLYLTPQGGGSS
jgi:general secretion pathway protein J